MVKLRPSFVCQQCGYETPGWYGIFVTLSPGVEGLIHISKVAPGEEPKVGQEITCLIEDIQPDKRKVSLSMTLTEKPMGYR
jgi:ribosomal protein S1